MNPVFPSYKWPAVCAVALLALLAPTATGQESIGEASAVLGTHAGHAGAGVAADDRGARSAAEVSIDLDELLAGLDSASPTELALHVDALAAEVEAHEAAGDGAAVTLRAKLDAARAAVEAADAGASLEADLEGATSRATDVLVRGARVGGSAVVHALAAIWSAFHSAAAFLATVGGDAVEAEPVRVDVEVAAAPDGGHAAEVALAVGGASDEVVATPAEPVPAPAAPAAPVEPEAAPLLELSVEADAEGVANAAAHATADPASASVADVEADATADAAETALVPTIG